MAEKRAEIAEKIENREPAGKAKCRFARVSPRKARYVADMLRGKTVDEAFQLLKFTHRPSAVPIIERLLKGAVASVDKREHPETGSLVIGKIYVDGGPIMYRVRPAAMGRAVRIRKRSAHITIFLYA
jgi:large subunit ribosomal protein L22